MATATTETEQSPEHAPDARPARPPRPAPGTTARARRTGRDAFDAVVLQVQDLQLLARRGAAEEPGPGVEAAEREAVARQLELPELGDAAPDLDRHLLQRVLARRQHLQLRQQSVGHGVEQRAGHGVQPVRADVELLRPRQHLLVAEDIRLRRQLPAQGQHAAGRRLAQLDVGVHDGDLRAALAEGAVVLDVLVGALRQRGEGRL